MHYSPIRETVVGEPEEIFPFLGASRLLIPIDKRPIQVVFHSHAHSGSLNGHTPAGIKVINVSEKVLLREGFHPVVYLIEI